MNNLTVTGIVRTCLVLLMCAAGAMAADISGKWSFSVELDFGSGNRSFVFQQDGEKLSGAYSGIAGEAKLTGAVKGNQVKFQFEASLQGETLTVEYAGTIEGPDKMKGTTRYGDFAEGTWTATKQR